MQEYERMTYDQLWKLYHHKTSRESELMRILTNLKENGEDRQSINEELRSLETELDKIAHYLDGFDIEEDE